MKDYVKFNHLLNSLEPYSIKLGLERIQTLLERFLNPEQNFKSILVGGTNGKGSVSQFLNDALVAKGYNVGLYTSPHLISINERIKINSNAIDYSTLLSCALKIYPAAKELKITYFEFLTTLAFVIFSEFKVEYAVLEVGMGGEFDATNVVKPILSIITSVSLDHTEHLGSTLEQITKTKIAIIKKVGVIAKNSKEVMSIIKTIPKPLYFVDENYLTKAQNFKLKFLKCDYERENLACAMLSIDILNKYYNMGLDYKALSNTYWPARFEVIKSKNKTFVIDGAHNIDGAKRFIKCAKNFPGKKILIYSSLKQKDFHLIIPLFLNYFDKVIITSINNKLSITKKDVEQFLDKATWHTHVNQAIDFALNSHYNYCFIAGSLYLCAQSKACNLLVNLP